MSKSDFSPDALNTMSDVRREVDRIDREIVVLLAQRFGCMTAAARIKEARDSVRDEERKAAVIAHVKKLAEEAGVPVPLVAALWEMLIENSISYEMQKWDRLRS